ncbi:MAG: ribonuclease III [Caulobacter vibrioides]|uniref:Ribonuclease III n=1 Tax=Caulobacter vibrioides TaxID=155892 RepID=A0A258D4K4_CAUVI|nr:MAG: ribonuclease III [Caulobacter vibrioides]
MFDDVTPRLGLPYVVAAQAQKHIPINESLARLDALVQLAVESRALAAQPVSPLGGGVWILPAGAFGAAWAGQSAGTLMRFEAGAWEPLIPGEGVLAWVKDENQVVAFDGTAWTPLSATFRSLTAAASPGLANTRLEILEQEVTLSGASTATTIVIPSNCGVAGEASKFGGALGVAKNASNVGVLGPTAYYADTPVVLTAVGGNFVGGKVRVAIHVLRFDAPASV